MLIAMKYKEIECIISAVIADITNIQSTDMEMGFFDLGVSSLTVTLITYELGRRFQINMDESEIFNSGNIRELAIYIARQKDG